MSTDEEAVNSAYKKLEREKVLMNAAQAMRQQTNNETVKSRLDAQMREGRRNIQYLEDTLRQLQMRRMNQGMDNMGLGAGDGGPSGRPQSGGFRNDRDGPPTPPPKDARGGYVEQGSDRGGYGTQEYSQIGGHGDLMPPRHPYGPPGPGSSGIPKQKTHYSKLGMYCH
jgi:Hr1 repeat